MKQQFKNIAYLIAILAMASGFSACDDDDAANDGNPIIYFARTTDPDSADSLLVAGFQGNMVAIVGDNLEKTIEIWFNDQRAELSPTYVTRTSILVEIPSDVPTVVTDKMALIFSNQDTLLYDFEVAINKPELNSMVSEYVFAGQVATIRGNYLYQPLTVTFTGGVEGTVVSSEEEDAIVQVVVPEGAEPGPITVASNFGSVESGFWFRDHRNIIISSDPWTGWWGETFVVTEPGENDPPAINGNYIRVRESIAPWQWFEVVGGPPDAMGDISKNFPDAAILNPENYYLKFEVNTLLPYDNNMISINVGLSDDFDTDNYQWGPPYDTQGAWETVALDLERVMANYSTSVSADGYFTRILIFGNGDLNADLAFDNFRIVPKSAD